ncbi:MAG TPA: sugar ABC transporter ATP-binding protein [Candidatus Brocadiia bacterium]|nr:sugar ABC transporter ATP-binding protein [Candidatus Brocadiia bacterium]
MERSIGRGMCRALPEFTSKMLSFSAWLDTRTQRPYANREPRQQSRGDDVPQILMKGIRKSFGEVSVLHGVDLELRAGNTLALVGENGAGKSTLIKVLAGVYPDYGGEIELDGKPLRMDSPRTSENAGVAVIFQELSLVPPMTVAENIFLGREPFGRLRLVNRGKMAAEAERLLGELGIHISPEKPVELLSMAERQMVEIAKALSRKVRFLIMDEPTSTLPEEDVERLFTLMDKLRVSGVGLLYVSHKLEEIYRVADRITVLRDGALVGTATPQELPPAMMIKWMVGREIDQFLPKHQGVPGEPVLSVRNMRLHDPVADRYLVDDVSFTVKAGEIVGLAGLRGAGNNEVLGAIFGRYGNRASGALEICGRAVAISAPRAALEAGIAYLSNDRKEAGIVPPMSVLHNMTLGSLKALTRPVILTRRREMEAGRELYEQLSVRAPSIDTPVENLSGGNQQKALLGRWLMRKPRVLLLDEPTRGIDVGAKAEIYRLMNELAEQGLGIVFTSTELQELLALSDRILVMHRGKLSRELSREEATQENVTEAAMQVSTTG